MAKVSLTSDQWTEVVTTTTDTLLSSPNGRLKFTTSDPDASGFTDDSHQLNRYEGAVVPAGLTVWVYPIEFLYGREQVVHYQTFGL